jgi:FixJ family two-component response regulator
VLEANGSADALKICTEHHGSIDLLLTDLVLPPPRSQLVSPLNQFPHVHGQELAERATRIRSGLRTILMSGNPDQELARHGIKRGTSPLLAKPFENDYLISLVQHVLVRPATPMVREQQSTAANEATS